MSQGYVKLDVAVYQQIARDASVRDGALMMVAVETPISFHRLEIILGCTPEALRQALDTLIEEGLIAVQDDTESHARFYMWRRGRHG